MYKKVGKRYLDFFLALLALFFLSWLLLILAVIVKVTSPGPVFFKQKRVGIKKTYFQMLANPEAYITPVGRFLRKTSLDELPQLFNILVGQMAIVGPRPALWNQDDLIAERDKYHANDVRPGLTGWAQINGRDEIEIPLKAKLDGEYMKRMSLLFDVRIVLGTVFRVLRSDGVKEGGTGEGMGNGR